MKFTQQTSRAANAIQYSQRCILRWQQVIAENIQSSMVGTAWQLIVSHTSAIKSERNHIKILSRS